MQYFNAQLAPLGFGAPTVPTHQPPRRFRVTGTGILPGARLEIAMRKTLNTTPAAACRG